MNLQSRKRRRIEDDVECNESTTRPLWQLPVELSSWATTYGPTALSVTALLKILNQFGLDLPYDSRSLMKTPRGSSKLIRVVEPGHYIHIGVGKGIKYVLRRHNVDISELSEISIDYDADGVKISESTTNVFWPIWVRIGPPYIGKPFLVGNFHSSVGEPNDPNLYLLDFVDEVKMLVKNGMEVEGKTIKVRLGRFLGDTPGRCMIMRTKGPTGYYGCGRCTTEGVRCNNRICFPELNAKLRTDENFHQREQPEHHHNTSLLESTLGVKCISQAPIDGMHLLYACVARRYIFWLVTDTVNYKFRLPSLKIDEIDRILKIAAISRPVEFARPVNDIRKYKKFKCTQNRQFLQYLSIVCLKNILTKFQYEHFLLLFIGIRILSDEKKFKDYNSLANGMLREYVEKLGIHFGKFRLIFSFHNLIHLAKETLDQNEPLDTFSMWDFETANSSLKKFSYRQGAFLEQTYNRTMEKYANQGEKEICFVDYPILRHIICSEFDESQNMSKIYFSSILFQIFGLSATNGNRWFQINSGAIAQFKKAIQINDNEIKIEVQVFKRKTDFFVHPLKSSFLNIFQCYDSDLSSVTEILNLQEVNSKMYAIKYEKSFIFLPLLSSG